MTRTHEGYDSFVGGRRQVMAIARKRRLRLGGLAALAVLLVPIAIVDAAKPVEQGNPVTHWNKVASDTLVVFPAPAGGAPPALQIHMAMVQGAVYDALNAISPKHHRPYLLTRRFAATASKGAATATAAYRVLTSIVAGVPDRIAFPNRATLLATLTTEYNASLAAIRNGPFKRQGIAAGNAAADAMIAARQGDGRFGPSQWVPNSAPGHWQPLLNTDGTPILDPTPWVGAVRPFLLNSPSQFRTQGPLELTSAAYAAELNEVQALGRVDSTVRTPEQTHIAFWWQSVGGPTVLFNGSARSLVEDPSLGVSVTDSARLFAMLNLSGADAAISCWNEKYYWDFWRPWHAIQHADLDENDATVADPTWTALLTAPYPDHTSGHLCLDGAHLNVLRIFFGTDNIGFDVTSSRFDGETRHFDRFSAPLEEIVEARIWAGLHFRTADVQGRDLGADVADYMAANFFQPVGRSHKR